MTDTRIQAAVDNWAARLIANGIEYGDFVRTTRSISRWEEWLDAWTATAEMHLALAEAAERDGHLRSAGEAFLRAAVSFHFAKFVWVLDAERNRVATERAVRALYRAHAVLDPSAARIEAPLGAGVVAGNLRLPAGERPAPLVIVIPGLDSTKEEFWNIESVFLARGMATLSLDGPGQGETGLLMPIRFDYEVAIAPALDALAGHPALDLDRVGLVGISLGGYYAARSAAFEPRVKAIAGVSGAFDLGSLWDTLPGLTREAFIHYSGSADADDGRRHAAALTLDGVAGRITQPCLVVTGRLDRVIPWEDTKRLADEAPRSEWVLYDEGTHVCNNIPFKYRPLMADWMRDRL